MLVGPQSPRVPMTRLFPKASSLLQQDCCGKSRVIETASSFSSLSFLSPRQPDHQRVHEDSREPNGKSPVIFSMTPERLFQRATLVISSKAPQGTYVSQDELGSGP